jgi:hypothetical protein
MYYSQNSNCIASNNPGRCNNVPYAQLFEIICEYGKGKAIPVAGLGGS